MSAVSPGSFARRTSVAVLITRLSVAPYVNDLVYRGHFGLPLDGKYDNVCRSIKRFGYLGHLRAYDTRFLSSCKNNVCHTVAYDTVVEEMPVRVVSLCIFLSSCKTLRFKYRPSPLALCHLLYTVIG